MFATKTKTTETFILPEEFNYYTQLGYTIFMSKPTMFGTYRAIKIEMLKEMREVKNQVSQPNVIRKQFSSISRLVSNLLPNYSKQFF